MHFFLLLYSHERLKFRPLDGWRDRGFCQCFWFWTSHFFNNKLRALGCSYSRSKNERHVVVCTHSYVTITHRYTLLFAPLHVPGRGALAALKTLTARLISYARQLAVLPSHRSSSPSYTWTRKSLPADTEFLKLLAWVHYHSKLGCKYYFNPLTFKRYMTD